jgi:phage host-nuclease inhibitor protein Gam
MTLPIIEAALATQEPVDGEALAPTGWRARSIADAEWAGEELGASEEEIRQVDAQLADLIARATARADAIKTKAQKRVAFFTAALVEFAETNRADLCIGKKKSRELVSVTFAWRKKAAKVIVTDKPALVEWLEQHGDPTLMRVRVEPDIKAIDAMILATGVLPPGLDLEPESETLTVTATALPQISASIQKELP